MSDTNTVVARGDFARLTDPFRRELLAHCSRMLGSSQDAEDLVQETYLRAWRSCTEFEGRSSLRSWLYRIATNACLTAIETRGRRPLPTGLGGPGRVAAAQDRDTGWLEPVARLLFGTEPADPAAVVETRAAVRLALATAWRHLPPRQRAVLILREVLHWRAAEVAQLLGTTSAAVNSMLQRARAQLSELTTSADDVPEPDDPCRRDLLDRYVSAFENADLTTLTHLLTDDAVCELPPDPAPLVGREAITRFMSTGCPAFGTCSMERVTYRGMPAFATYLRAGDGAEHAYSVEALTVTGAGIARITSHQDPALFDELGLPRVR
ncbi:RNA polymerase subunit sigma-70 [Saccharothrix sp. Mg75]|uniref:RNA polymerase subunit sigma-70 n=1 Tax=Saccharothrix sp. Mg75 TaxID=3445357 RepID=UPI003EEA57A1